MSFLIAKIISRLKPRQHKLSCSWITWWRLLVNLRARGCGETQESGAFLLGHYRPNGSVRIVKFVLYDDLDPHCLDTGIVRFNGRYFGNLWEICRKRKLKVVADIHVHPGCSAQSISDRQHPMISRPNHLAIILPHFARSPVRKEDIGIYEYLGNKQWKTVPRHQRRNFIRIGW